MSIDVKRAESRYEITVDGDLAGVAEFRQRSGRIVFTHTEIDPSFEGRGLGSRLAHEALSDAAARDEVIVPLCPFLVRYLQGHDIPGARIELPEQ